jgi:hypothetical protein
MRWGVRAMAWPFYPRERPGNHCIGGWVAPGPVWTGAENLATIGIRSADCPARNELGSSWNLNHNVKGRLIPSGRKSVPSFWERRNGFNHFQHFQLVLSFVSFWFVRTIEFAFQ